MPLSFGKTPRKVPACGIDDGALEPDPDDPEGRRKVRILTSPIKSEVTCKDCLRRPSRRSPK